MPPRPCLRCHRWWLTSLIFAAALVLAGCGGPITKLQPPTAGIQQLTVNTDGSWAVVVRFQNYSYDTGMHVYAIDAALQLNGAAAGHIALSPALDVPAMDADVATVTLRPDAAGISTLAAAGHGALQYALKGTLSVGKGNTGKAQSFPLDGKGYISPVPGVSNVWR